MAAPGSVPRQCADHCTRGRRTLAPFALSLSLHHPHPTTQVRNIDLGPAIAKTTVANLKSKVKRLGGELASQRSVAARAEVRRRDCATRPHACCARLAPRCPSACRAQRRAALSSRRTPAHPIASVLSHRHCNATLRSRLSFRTATATLHYARRPPSPHRARALARHALRGATRARGRRRRRKRAAAARTAAHESSEWNRSARWR